MSIESNLALPTQSLVHPYFENRILVAKADSLANPRMVTNATLLGPRADILMIGGASIVVCLLYWMFVDSAASLTNIGLLAFYASSLVNFPHFAASYQLLYGDYRKLIFRKMVFNIYKRWKDKL